MSIPENMKIAVVGASCHYPGASSVKELVENILAGRRYFREVPAGRWRLEDYYNPDPEHPDTTYCKRAAFIEGFKFNASDFKIPRSTYLATDEAQWLALQTAKDALDDANLSNINLETTAVIIGNTLAGEVSRAHVVRYRWPYTRRVIEELLDNLNITGETREQILKDTEERYKAPFPPVNEDNLAGGLANTIAGRICNHFDFKGGGYVVDGACSSSLLSIQEGCIGLSSHLCDLVLAGGVDISLDPFELVGFAKVGALSDSDIRVYDARSNGFLPGEGCGIVVLKRLEDAVADKDTIYGVIRGVGYSSDGKGGITAPSVPGQSLAVDRAYHIAGYSFADVELIEGHGTGTPVGDQTELTTFMEGRRRHGASSDQRCGIGSIKSIIGHTKAAAGVAGFIKSVMALYYETLPPTMGLKVPNPMFDSSETLYPLIKGRKWDSKKPLRSAVSSAGFGGINTHITMESYDGKKQKKKKIIDPVYLMQSYQDSEVFLFGASDATELYNKVSGLIDIAGRLCHAELVDLAMYCADNLADNQVRLSIVADTPENLLRRLVIAQDVLEKEKLSTYIDFTNHAEGIYLQKAYKMPRIAFLFPGQGSQSLNMGERWKERYVGIEKHWDECDRITKDLLDEPLSSYIFKQRYWESKEKHADWNAKLTDTAIAQPAIVAASMAISELLTYIGVEPDVSLGHSLGEYTALWSSGYLDKETTLRLVSYRGKTMAEAATGDGAMISIAESVDVVTELLNEIKDYVVISNHNAPMQTVVSGELKAIEAVQVLCEKRSILARRLPVSGAFHSKLMNKAAKKMADKLAECEFDEGEHLLASTVSGRFIESAAEVNEQLAKQITAPVRFTDVIDTVLKEEVDMFIEVGPGTVLTGLVNRIADDDSCLTFATDSGQILDDCVAWNKLVGHLFACGIPLMVKRVFENRFSRPFKFPYAPEFISSPCEFPVEPLQLNVQMDMQMGTLTTKEATDKPAAPLQESTAETESEGINSADDVFRKTQKYIIDKFGYPQDMVSHDALLGQDLNLDSIKSAEVVAEAMAQLDVQGDPTSMTGLSLMDLSEKLFVMSTEGNNDGSSESSERSHFFDQFPTWTRSFSLQVKRSPMGKQTAEWPEQKILLLALQNDSLVTELKKQLESSGHSVELAIGSLSEVSQTPITACIVIAPATVDCEVMAIKTDKMDEHLSQLPIILLESAKHLLGKESGLSKDKLFALVSQGDGLYGRSDNVPKHAEYLAGSGFVKTLSLENEDLSTLSMDLDPALGAKANTKAIIKELNNQPGHTEAGYPADGERRQFYWQPTASNLWAKSELSFKKDEVVIFTGGGKGVAAECALAFARRYKVKLALVGSSPIKIQDETSELAINLKRFESESLLQTYYSCDITDHEAVTKLIKKIEKEMGPVAGIIHAAGLNIPHRVEHLSNEDFIRVLKPKIQGLTNLLGTVDLDRLKLCSVFSSIIGQSGMPGNSDYAYANEWMNRILLRLRQTHPAIVCKAYNYSVWAEIGMGMRHNTLTGLRSLGIDAIPAEQGIKSFIDLMGVEWPDIDLIISARVNGLDTLKFADYKLPHTRFIEKVLAFQPSVELTTEVFLTPDQDQYLKEHNYEGSLLFPAVVGIEAMSQVASACIGDNAKLKGQRPELKNLQFKRPIVVPEQGRAIRIHAVALELTEDGVHRVKVSIRSSLSDYDEDYFSGECVWNADNAALPSENIKAWPAALSVDPHEVLYGSIYFQGPMFQNIVEFYEVSSTHCLAKISIPKKPELFANPNGYPSLMHLAEVRDAFLHSVQICVPEYKILPISMERIMVQDFKGDHIYLSATETFRSDKEREYELNIYDEKGQCIEQINGYRCRVLDDYENQPVLEHIAAIYAESEEARVEAVNQVI